ncbi:MAG: hypothetical protein GF331_12490 [Chitinivibrionales bacterium]|nr:hypothetical protein [Chitinivibrionales bacterium]
MMHRIILLTALLSLQVSAQNSMVITTTGDEDAYDLASISKITFTATDMVLGGVAQTYVIDDVERIAFADITSAMPVREETAPMTLSPCRHALLLAVRAELDCGATATIYTLAGQVVRHISFGPDNKAVWNWTDERGQMVARGTYAVKVRLGDVEYLRSAIVTF